MKDAVQALCFNENQWTDIKVRITKKAVPDPLRCPCGFPLCLFSEEFIANYDVWLNDNETVASRFPDVHLVHLFRNHGEGNAEERNLGMYLLYSAPNDARNSMDNTLANELLAWPFNRSSGLRGGDAILLEIRKEVTWPWEQVSKDNFKIVDFRRRLFYSALKYLSQNNAKAKGMAKFVPSETKMLVIMIAILFVMVLGFSWYYDTSLLEINNRAGELLRDVFGLNREGFKKAIETVKQLPMSLWVFPFAWFFMYELLFY